PPQVSPPPLPAPLPISPTSATATSPPHRTEGDPMFTGLVTAMGTFRALEPTADGARLVLTGDLPPHTTLGDSIAVDGVCVSITSLDSAGSGLRGSPGS